MACGADPTGKWRPEIGSGEWVLVDPTLSLRADGSRLTGTIGTPLGTTQISEGRVDDDCISFTVAYGGARGKVEYRGKLGRDFMYLTESTAGGRELPWVRFAGRTSFYSREFQPVGSSMGYIREGVRLRAPLGLTVKRGGAPGAVAIRILEGGNSPVKLSAVVLPAVPGLAVSFSPDAAGNPGTDIIMTVTARNNIPAGVYVLTLGDENGVPIQVLVQ